MFNLYKAKRAFCAALLMLTCGMTVAHSQTATRRAGSTDREVSRIVQAVSSRQLRTNIEKLVSFGTRNTISSATPEDIKAGHGIGAAREWIKANSKATPKNAADASKSAKTALSRAQPHAFPSRRKS